jgi:hypothetical protein
MSSAPGGQLSALAVKIVLLYDHLSWEEALPSSDSLLSLRNVWRLTSDSVWWCDCMLLGKVT